MKYFVPISDDLLLSDSDMKRYRLVPYNPDFLHIRAVRKAMGKPSRSAHSGRYSDEKR